MHRFLSTLLLPLLLAALAPREAGAQPDEPVVRVEGETPPYYGLGAGYQRMLTLVDYDDQNALNKSLGLPDFTGFFNTDLGGLFFTPGMVRNLRVGFYAGSGTDQVAENVTLRDGSVYTRTVYFSNTLVTSAGDIALPLSNPLTLFVGTMVGGARTTIGVSQTRVGGESFGSLFEPELFNGEPTATSGNLNRFARLLQYTVYLYPQINLEYSLSPNILFRVGGGYVYGVPITGWADEGGTKVEDTPDFSANGLTIHVGLFAGLFRH